MPEAAITKAMVRSWRATNSTITVAAGLVLIRESLAAIRTGTAMHMLHGPDIDGHVALAAFVCVIVLGVAVISVGARDR